MKTNTPKAITVSVENALPEDQREALKNLRDSMVNRHRSNLSAMHRVGNKRSDA